MREKNEDAVINSLNEMKTAGVISQAVSLIVQSSHVSIDLLQALLDLLLPLYNESEKG